MGAAVLEGEVGEDGGRGGRERWEGQREDEVREGGSERGEIRPSINIIHFATWPLLPLSVCCMEQLQTVWVERESLVIHILHILHRNAAVLDNYCSIMKDLVGMQCDHIESPSDLLCC